jgi:hypothetical protein
MADSNGGDKLVEVILCGIDVSKKLHTAHPSFPKDINSFADMVEQAMSAGGGNFKLYIHPRIYKADAIIGRIENYNSDRADIVYDLDQNVCWRRFVITKEICHVLYNPASQEYLTATPDEVEQLVNKLMTGVDVLSSNHALNCDSSTRLMALEILLPHHQRGNVDAMLKSGKTTHEVACHYRLPEDWVRIYLSPGYATLMDKCYKLAGM